jgi:hypothetical protein
MFKYDKYIIDSLIITKYINKTYLPYLGLYNAQDFAQIL